MSGWDSPDKNNYLDCLFSEERVRDGNYLSLRIFHEGNLSMLEIVWMKFIFVLIG